MAPEVAETPQLREPLQAALLSMRFPGRLAPSY